MNPAPITIFEEYYRDDRRIDAYKDIETNEYVKFEGYGVFTYKNHSYPRKFPIVADTIEQAYARMEAAATLAIDALKAEVDSPKIVVPTGQIASC